VPRELTLPALQRSWRVIAQGSSAPVRVRAASPDELAITGRVDDEPACRAALARWLVRVAQDSLLARLHELSARLDMPYRRARIKRQRTRWGSCSRDQTINLNARLLFQPPEVMDYVLIHELCHLQELNHSRRFWSLVARHDPEYRAHDRALRDGWKRVPRWAS
jgi:hypothetical protein